MTPLGNAALKLAERGMRVFPCIERAKEPAIHNNLKHATTDHNKISGWWSKRHFNISIATGDGSGIWVLDVDGDEGETELRKLETEHGPLPSTVEAITGKGRHLYFRWPTGWDIRNKQNNPVMPGIDVRGNGGYVLAPPSIHPSGRPYAWSVDSGSDFEDAPEWLLDLVVRGGNGGQPMSPEAWQSFLEEHVEGSRRGSAVARAYGHLLRKSDPVIALGYAQLFNESRCHPPLDRSEVENIARDINTRESEQIRNQANDTRVRR
jgi:hypothetical protein